MRFSNVKNYFTVDREGTQGKGWNKLMKRMIRDRKQSGTAVDILNGPLVSSLLLFALPIAVSGMLQQLFNFADTAVVGHFTDSTALAAVGTNGEITALMVTLCSGLSVGVNVRIASLIGSGRENKVSKSMRTVWILGAAAGLLLGASAFILAEPVLHLIHTPEEAMSQAVIYLRLYAAGVPALMIYDFGSAVLRAYGDSRRPLMAMVFSGIINVMMNLFLVIVLGMGVAGVALATDLSSLFSAVLVVRWVKELIKDSSKEAFLKFQKSDAEVILKIGLPAAVQGAVFCFANIFVQSAVNSFGTDAAAGAAAAMNFEYLTYYAITAFGQTAVTFTGQNYSAGNRQRCRKIGIWCVVLSAVCCGCMTVPLCIFRYQAAGIFSSDPAVIEAAAVRMITILLYEPLCAVYESLSGVLRGMGHSLMPAVLTILGTCVLRIAWIQTVFRWFGTPGSLYTAFPVSWVVTSLAVVTAYDYLINEKMPY